VTQKAVTANVKKGRLEKNYYAYIFLAPFIAGFLLFGLYPIFNTFYLSLTNTTIMSKTHAFIGFDNFTALFKDKFFSQSIGNTWFIWIMNFIPQLGAALLLSVWFTSTRLRLKSVSFWRAMLYLPNLLMPATIAVLFFSFFSYYGPINQTLVRLGLQNEAIHYMNSESFAKIIVAFIQWWMWFGSTIIVLMAGMTSISTSLYESAMVDGARGWDMFTSITLPLLKPVMVYTLVTSLVGGMQMFDIPYLLTDGRGSPNGSIMTMNILMYMKFSSSKGHIGAAATVGVMIFIITTFCSAMIFRLLRENDEVPAKKKEAISS
jgi:cellobiose transport system permease protein